MSVPVGVVPKDRQLQTLVIEAWKIQSVAHLVHFARKMQSRRGMLTHGAAVCLPGTDLQWSLAKSRWLTRLSLPLSGLHPAKAQAGPVLHLVILFSLQARWQTLLLVIGSNESKGDLEHGTGVKLTMLTTVASYWEIFFIFYFCLFLYFHGFSVLETGSHCVTYAGMELTSLP